MNASPLVSIRSVCKTFRRRQGTIEVLHNISLELGKGEVTHLTGPSGSGKTTLLNLIAALDHPDSGTIVVAGEDLARLSLAAAAKFRSEYVGIVFQSYKGIYAGTPENSVVPHCEH